MLQAFGRVARLVTQKADRIDFSLGLEGVVSGTGLLTEVSGAEYEGVGIAFCAGDVLFGKLRPYLAKAWVADRAGAAVGDFHVYRPTEHICSDYLGYVLLSRSFLDPVTASVLGAKMPRTSWGFVRNVRIYVPSLSKQRTIADYLDRETAKIDALIGKQEQLIETLRERRTSIKSAVFARRVGKGNRLRWSITEVDKRAGDEWQSLPLMSVSISWGVRPRSDVSNNLSRAEELGNYKVCEQNQVVINRMRAFQGALGVSPIRGLVSPDYSVLNISPRVNVEWLVMGMTSDTFVSQMASRVRGIGSSELGSARTPRINVSDLGNIRLAVPPLAEQIEELAVVSTETAKIDLLISKAELFIELAKERRSALITAVVTGQIDVRGELSDKAQEQTEMEPI